MIDVWRIVNIWRITIDVSRMIDIWRITIDVWRIIIDVFRIIIDVWRIIIEVWRIIDKWRAGGRARAEKEGRKGAHRKTVGTLPPAGVCVCVRERYIQRSISKDLSGNRGASRPKVDKSAPMAPRTQLSYPHEGPSVVLTKDS